MVKVGKYVVPVVVLVTATTLEVFALVITAVTDPENVPVKDPVNDEFAPVSCREEFPDITVPLSVRLELANAAPVHLVIALLVNDAAPETATLCALLPL